MDKLTVIPLNFFIGDTLTLELPGGDYPATDYSLTLVLVSSEGKLTATSTASGKNHLLSFATDTLSSGRYDYQLKAIADGFCRTIKTGATYAFTDFSATTLTTHDGRSHVKKVFDALEATIEGRASKTQMFQTVGGVQIQHLPHDQLVDLRDRYLLKYHAELVAAGERKLFGTIKSRFRS